MQPYSLFTYPPPYDRWAIHDERDAERVATIITLDLAICGLIWFGVLLVSLAR
jgi:hypothetical protein